MLFFYYTCDLVRKILNIIQILLFCIRAKLRHLNKYYPLEICQCPHLQDK